MILKHIKIQGMHGINREYDLKQKMFFAGSNGSGKSTVLQAIQWALLGYIPGTNKTNVAMMAHASGPMMSVTLEIDCDGIPVTIFRQLLKTGSNVAAQTIITPDEMADTVKDAVARIELPIFNFAEFAGMTANKLKDWFVDYLPKAQCDIHWDAFIDDNAEENGILLSNDSRKIVREVIDSAIAGKSGVDAIRSVNTACKTAVSNYKAESARVASTLQSLNVYEGDDDIFELRSEKSRLSNIIDRIATYNLAAAANRDAETALSRYSDLAENIDSDTWYAAAQTNLNALMAESAVAEEVLRIAEMNRRMKAAERQEVERTVNSDGCCPLFADVVCTVVAERKGTAKLKLDSITDEIAELDRAVTEARRAVETNKNAINAIDRKLSLTRSRYQEREFYKNALKPVPDVSDIDNLDIDYWRATRDKVVERISQIENNALVDNLTQEKMRVDTLLAVFKIYEKMSGVNGLQCLIESPFTQLISDMTSDIQTLLHSDPEFVVTDKANSFSFGIRRDDEYIAYDMLSSGEKALYCLAMTTALIKYNADCKLLILDDIFDHIDTANTVAVSRWFDSLDDIQCIVAGVNPIEGLTYQAVR